MLTVWFLLQASLVTAKHVHGRTGLDGTSLPDPSTSVSKTHAVDFIIKELTASKEKEITITSDLSNNFLLIAFQFFLKTGMEMSI